MVEDPDSELRPLSREAGSPKKSGVSLLWQCPDCGRRFPKARQWHSCTVRGNFLRVGFLSTRRIADRRIVHIERLGPAKFGHSVVIESLADLDEVVMGWLAAAYRLNG